LMVLGSAAQLFSTIKTDLIDILNA
jgi:hypothetical protein